MSCDIRYSSAPRSTMTLVFGRPTRGLQRVDLRASVHALLTRNRKHFGRVSGLSIVDLGLETSP